uniref:MIF4G domain-containing protein n=1 Tax=Romanomermis culicivorax TaxID=13658 RepID=A0A915K9S9_ROMCU
MKESKCERATTSTPGASMKRSGSFVKDLPKKKTFGSKEAQEAKLLFDALGVANDDTIKEWLSGAFESIELATPVGQLLVQIAIEHSKSPKTVGKLVALLIDFQFNEVYSIFRYWLSFINCLTELYSNLGFTYDGELVQILLQVYNYLLEPSILEDIKIEELECLISSLLSVGYNLERQYPDKLSEFLAGLRDSFIQAHEPWVRKMLLLMIELCACSWKLPSEANDYYFQAHYSSS